MKLNLDCLEEEKITNAPHHTYSRTALFQAWKFCIQDTLNWKCLKLTFTIKLYSRLFKYCLSANQFMKWRHLSNQDTFRGPMESRSPGVPLSISKVKSLPIQLSDRRDNWRLTFLSRNTSIAICDSTYPSVGSYTSWTHEANVGCLLP